MLMWKRKWCNIHSTGMYTVYFQMYHLLRLIVFDNRVVRSIFGPKRDEANRVVEKITYSSPNMIWVIKLRILRWAGHVAQVGERRGAYQVLVVKYD